MGQPPVAQEVPTLSVAPSDDGTLRISNVGLEEALEIVARWLEGARPDLAKQLLSQLEPIWPHDARIPYLRGLVERALGDENAASEAFARALHLYPQSPTARYELANSLLAGKDWDRSAYHFRFLIAEETPEEIRTEVYRALGYIEDQRDWRFSADLSIEPSSNINSAPTDPEIDPIFGGATGAVLTQGSTAVDGIGVRGRLGVVRYVPIRELDAPDRRVRMLFGASIAAVEQSDSRFDDASSAVTAGLVMRDGRNTFGLNSTMQKRWFGGDEYETASGLGFSYSRHLDAPLILHFEVNATDRDNAEVDALDGVYLTGETRLRWQLGLTRSIDVAASAGRMDAAAGSQSFDEGALAASYSIDIASGIDVTFGTSFYVRDYDARDPFFNLVREDNVWALSASATKRDTLVLGFAPYVRVGWTQSESSLKVYAFERADVRLGLTSVY